MKNFKQEKGITLIALIITIVVLLILAVVAIGQAKESNVVGYAQNAVSTYEAEKENEKQELVRAEELLARYEIKDKEEKKENTEIGAKAYATGEGGVSVFSPDNQLNIFYSTSSNVPDRSANVEEGLGNWNVTFVGFEEEEKQELQYFSTDFTVFATSPNRDIVYMPVIDGNNATISKQSYAMHSNELLAQYYHDDPNVEYYYGEWDTIQLAGSTINPGEFLYKIDYNENKISMYGKTKGDSTWSNYELSIEKNDTNGTEINITVDGNPVTITTNAIKLETSMYGIKRLLYIQSGVLYSGDIMQVGEQLKSGYDTQSLIKYINTSALPQ